MLKIRVAIQGFFARREVSKRVESVLFVRDQFAKLSERKLKVPVSMIRL